MKSNNLNQKQLPPNLYNAAVLRAGKGAKDWTLEKILEEAEANGMKLAYGTVQSILKGTAEQPDLLSLWTIALVLEVPMPKVFELEETALSA